MHQPPFAELFAVCFARLRDTVGEQQQAVTRSADDAVDLAKANSAHLEWDPVDRTAWMYFYRDDEREWIFYTDVRTFKERYALVKDRELYGFCIVGARNRRPRNLVSAAKPQMIFLWRM